MVCGSIGWSLRGSLFLGLRRLCEPARNDAAHPLDAALGFPQGAELLPLAWGEAQTAYYWFFHGHSRIVILWAHYLLVLTTYSHTYSAAQKCLRRITRGASTPIAAKRSDRVSGSAVTWSSCSRHGWVNAGHRRR